MTKRLLHLLVVAVIAATGTVACQSPRTGTLVDWFMSAAKDEAFQAEGPVSGTFSMHSGSTDLKGTISGHVRIKSHDSALSVSGEIAGVTTTTDSVYAGPWQYQRQNGGPWSRTARVTKSTDSLQVVLDKTGGLEDKGIYNRNGRKLHRIGLRDISALRPEDLWLNTDVADTGANISYSNFTFAFWAQDDGTPAGMSFAADLEQKAASGTVTGSLSLDFDFESLSGVVIEVPEGAAEQSTSPYPQAVQLKADVAALNTASGSIEGSYVAGSENLFLQGTVKLANGASEIHMSAGQTRGNVWSEIVAGGVRYVSRDDTVWVNRGKKTTATLIDVLTAANTSEDAGYQTVGGRRLHRIVTATAAADVASALGLDFGKVSGPGGRLWLWADDGGRLAGFGASLQWGRIVNNSAKSFSLSMDVLLSTTEEVSIAAPKNPWRWFVDKERGVAFGLPSQFGKISGAIPLYRDSKTRATVFGYSAFDARGTTAKQAMEQAMKGIFFSKSNQYQDDVDGQNAVVYLGSECSVFSSKCTVFDIGYAVVQGQVGHVFLFAGLDSQRKATEILSDQIIATIEFLN